MMLILRSLLIIIALFGATIFIHELGHFLVARRLGLVVEVFSIGFGPALWKRRRNGVVYKIGIIPFGGYVALPQMDPSLLEGDDATERKDEDGRSLPPPPPVAPWKKIAVALAGAAGNMLFAAALAWVVYFIGKPSAPDERSAGVGYVAPDSAAAAAGLRPGDVIRRVNGRPVGNWQDLVTLLTIENLDTFEAEVEPPDGAARTLTLPTERLDVGVRLPAGVGRVNILRVWAVNSGSSAEEAGLRKGDTLLEFAGEKLYSREHLIQLAGEYRDREAPLVIRRDGQTLTVNVRPQYEPEMKRALIGIWFDTIGNVDYDKVVHPRPGRQLREHAGGIFRLLRAFTSRRQARAAAGTVGGPVSIFLMYWHMVQASIRMALWFTVFLNVNLAILNLLPFPVLDGGHILFSVWEWIAGRPAHRLVISAAYRLFATLLIALFIYLTYRDTMRFLWPARPRPVPTATETPAETTEPAPDKAAEVDPSAPAPNEPPSP